ncbi:M48 family peptidase [Aquitalea sp. S1-19]|nr:M48 family peptidase [Aquitalea sp. S1-19]
MAEQSGTRSHFCLLPSAFWLRVECPMPDYAQRKAWLAEHGMEVEVEVEGAMMLR